MGIAVHLKPKRNEEALTRLHALYRGRGLALVWHAGVRAVYRRSGVVAEKSPPDYCGVLTCLGGRAVSFDAKRTRDAKTYRHPNERLHQLQTLWDVWEAGGVACLR